MWTIIGFWTTILRTFNKVHSIDTQVEAPPPQQKQHSKKNSAAATDNGGADGLYTEGASGSSSDYAESTQMTTMLEDAVFRMREIGGQRTPPPLDQVLKRRHNLCKRGANLRPSGGHGGGGGGQWLHPEVLGLWTSTSSAAAASADNNNNNVVGIAAQLIDALRTFRRLVVVLWNCEGRVVTKTHFAFCKIFAQSLEFCGFSLQLVYCCQN